MTEGVIRTQGTELYVADTLSASVAAALKFVCPTGITGLGGAKDQIESTCLDTMGDKEFVSGLGNPGQVSVPFNFIPRNLSHQILFDLKESGETLKWIELFSESNAVPTLDGNGEFIAPASRTSAKFDAYISDVNIDAATNEIVRGTLTLQRSGQVDWFFYVP